MKITKRRIKNVEQVTKLYALLITKYFSKKARL